jgi:hypothetical protein
LRLGDGYEYFKLSEGNGHESLSISSTESIYDRN